MPVTVDITYTGQVCEIRDWLEQYVGPLGWTVTTHHFDYRSDIDTVTVSIEDLRLETMFALVWHQ